MTPWSTMTPEETFRMTGALTPEQTEALLDIAHGYDEVLAAADAMEAAVEEARAAYPVEDFLDPIRYDLEALSRNLRGANRETLERILVKLDDLERRTADNSEHGISELRSALKKLE